jgi:GntR family transcriptional regulator, transcriptional repressor for pyruvate dehydrogenase complex
VNPQTVVADIADELARRVASGRYAPGDLVPSVRQVAAEFEVNRATAQLVLGRLESAGFVQARRGKGFTVRDVRLSGGVDVYRRLFRLSMHMPEIALETFHDIVETEQALLRETVYAYSIGEHRIASAEFNDDVDRLEEIARTAETAAGEPRVAALVEFLQAELRVLRNLVSAVGQTMQLATLNSIGEMVLDVPEAIEAYFVVAPDVHVLVWRALAGVWDNAQAPTESEVALFDDLISMYHTKVVAKFEELIEGAADQGAFGSATVAPVRHVASA